MSSLNRFYQQKRFLLPLALPVLLYFAVTLFWQSRKLYPITGDEPHYLLLTDSLVRDHDVAVLNNYMIDTPVKQATDLNLAAFENLSNHTVGQFSLHNVALPFLLAIPYAVAGVGGAKLFLALLAGLWPFLIYAALFEITKSRGWSVIVALTLAVGLPFSAAANQVYPDPLAGMIIFGLTWKLFPGLQSPAQQSLSRLRLIPFSLGIGFLPWLHIRFAAPAVLLLLARTYVTARHHTGKRDRLIQYLVPVIVLIVSLVGVGIYDYVAYSNFLGPYSQGSLGNSFRVSTMIFLGLHWDQAHGMFMQQPLLLLGLAGLAPLIKANWRGAILIALLYLSVILPNAMHPVWYGGFSFVGRFWWALVALWIFPLAFAVKALRQQRLLLLLLCSGGVLLQMWFATKWVFQDGFLLRQGFYFWSSRSFYEVPGLQEYLPSFKFAYDYLEHPPNYVFVMLGLLLIVSGWLWRRGAINAVANAWIGFLLVSAAAIALVPPMIGSWTLAASGLPSRIGTIEGDARVAHEKDGPGVLVYGPYTPLLAGFYELTWEYDSTDNSNPAIGHFDIVQGPPIVTVAEADLPPSSATHGEFKYRFSVNARQSLGPLFQFRLAYPGQGSLKLKRLVLTPISFDD